jgi:hypothetical protein
LREKPFRKRSPKFHAFTKAWDSAWFSETRAYRHFAQRAFNVIQHEYDPADGTVRLIWLLQARQGQDINYSGYTPQLRGYLDEMYKLMPRSLRGLVKPTRPPDLAPQRERPSELALTTDHASALQCVCSITPQDAVVAEPRSHGCQGRASVLFMFS